MNKKEFYEDLKNCVLDRLGDGFDCEVQQIAKVNLTLDGLVIHKENSNVSPTIYLNRYEKEFKEGRAMWEIVSEIMEIYFANRNPKNLEEKALNLIDFEQAKKKVILKVINAERNQELLKNMPHIPMKELGLAAVFYVELEVTGTMTSGFYVRNSWLENWNTTVEELLELATINLNCRHHFIVQRMDEILAEIFAETGDDEGVFNASGVPLGEDYNMYVLSDENKIIGSSTLFLDAIGTIRDFAQKMGCDLYILPSSLHELILLRTKEGDNSAPELEDMVREVNATQVAPEDFLSDYVYRYQLREDKIVRA